MRIALKMCLYQTDNDLSNIDPTKVGLGDNVQSCPLEGNLVWRKE